MTEYDYSPEALERHLAKQAGIASWVDRTNQHEPANPFVHLPGEQTSDHIHPPQSAPQHPYPQKPPQPAFYSNARGVISPTYSSSSKKHHHREKHVQKGLDHSNSSIHHINGTQMMQPIPQTATASLPMGSGLTYAPVPQRSLSTPIMPVSTANRMMVPVTMTSGQSYVGYPAYQQQLASPPTMQLQYGYPAHPYTTMAPPATAMVSPPPPLNSRPSFSSHSHSSSRSSSSHSVRPAHFQRPSYGSATPPSNQPTIISINGGSGGYFVIPPGQSVNVIEPHAQYNQPYPSVPYPHFNYGYQYPQYQSQYQAYTAPTSDDYDHNSDSKSDHSKRGPASILSGLNLKELAATLANGSSGKRLKKGGRMKREAIEEGWTLT